MKHLDHFSLAAELLAALDQGRRVEPPTTRAAGFDFPAAYRTAAEILRLRRARGERSIGRKIGFTNRGIWAEYGVDSPIWAHVYQHTVQHAEANRATQSLARMVSPRIEPEIVLRLAAPVPAGSSNPASILRAIQWIAPGFEIVDCHYPDWKFRGPDSAADFSFHAALVVGSPRELVGQDLDRISEQIRSCQVLLRREGTVMDRGRGANALGHPALALAFLVDVIAQDPEAEALAPGEIVTTGTLTRALPIAPGETWSVDYGDLGIGPLAVTFTQ